MKRFQINKADDIKTKQKLLSEEMNRILERIMKMGEEITDISWDLIRITREMNK